MFDFKLKAQFILQLLIGFAIVSLSFFGCEKPKAPGELEMPEEAIAYKGSTVIPFTDNARITGFRDNAEDLFVNFWSLNEHNNAIGTNIKKKRILRPGASGIRISQLNGSIYNVADIGSLFATQPPADWIGTDPQIFGNVINNYYFYHDTLSLADALQTELERFVDIIQDATGETGFLIFPLAITALPNDNALIVHRYGIISQVPIGLIGTVTFNTINNFAFQKADANEVLNITSNLCTGGYTVDIETVYVNSANIPVYEKTLACDLDDYGLDVTFKFSPGL